MVELGRKSVGVLLLLLLWHRRSIGWSEAETSSSGVGGFPSVVGVGDTVVAGLLGGGGPCTAVLCGFGFGLGLGGLREDEDDSGVWRRLPRHTRSDTVS